MNVASNRNPPDRPVGDGILSNSTRSIAAAFGCLLVWCSAASARPIGNATVPTLSWPARADAGRLLKTRVEESRPSIYYLPDKQGNLQPVLDFKYEEFEELYKLKHRLGRRVDPPRYVLQRMSVAGTATEGHAELTVRFQVLVRDGDWVRVPLRLDQGLLRGEVQYKGSGRQFVDCEEEGAGYICWIRGKPDTLHEVALTMLVPLDAVGDETRLKLFAPRAGASELKMTVPVAGAIGAVSDGAALLSSHAAEGGTTEFRVARLTGDFQLAWNKPAALGAETPAVLEAIGTVLARLDGRGITSKATLSVRSLGAAFDRFSVRLPPEAELVVPAVKAAGYAVAPAIADDKEKEPRRTVEVRLARKTTGPVDVRIACRRDIEPVEGGPWLELAGFEVVAAARQWGTIAVAADGRRQVLWGSNDRTRQVHPLPDALRKENAIAGFEYFGQPFSLTVRLAPRGTRIAVEPEFVLLVERNRVQLEGKLAYTVRGEEVSTLRVAIPGWELDEVGPERLVAGDGVSVEGETVSIPLVRPMSGAVEVWLRAHRVIGESATSLTITLPRPKADSIAPATLAVTAADNVELTPNDQRIEGLTRQPGAPPVVLPARQQGPLYYRGSGGPGVFAADFRVHRRRIAVDVTGQVTFADGAAMVQQKFSYVVLHEPVGYFMLDAPRELATSGRIQVMLDGKPLSLILTGDDRPPVTTKGGTSLSAAKGVVIRGTTPFAALRDVPPETLTPVSLRVMLPEARIGQCELTLNYSVAAAEPSPERPAAVTVPLPMPADGELASNVITVRAARNIRPRLRNDGWSAADRSETEYDARGELRLTAPQRRRSLDLDLLWKKDDEAKTTVVDRALVQSWFTSVSRQDRAVFQFTTDRQEIEVLLPAGAAVGQAVVLVDGLGVVTRLLEENRTLGATAGLSSSAGNTVGQANRGTRRLEIPLGGSGESRRVTVELRYHFPHPRSPRGALSLEIPRLKSDAWIRRTYWQLILPANEHLIAVPAGWTGEYVWGWSGGFWARRQSIDQTKLESWAGAAPLDPPIKRANRYLFSSFGKPPRAEARMAGRTWIVLWASGAALVVGLLLIYVPAGRRPATLFVAGVALLAAGLIAPEPTLLLAQAAVLGLVLALLAGLLERGLIGRRRAPSGKEPSSSRVDLRAVNMVPSSVRTETPPSTEPMPSIVPQSTGKPQQ